MMPRDPKNQSTVSYQEWSDAKLLSNLGKSREEEIFTALFKRYGNKAFSLAYRVTRSKAAAEEVVQEVFLKIWKGADGFRPDGNAQGWILMIVAREALKQLRSKRREKDRIQRYSEKKIIDEAPRPETIKVKQDQIELLRAGLDQLPEINRRIVVLYFGGGMTQRQIGENLNLSTRVVSHKLALALQKLKSLLAANESYLMTPALVGSLLQEAVLTGPECSGEVFESILLAAADYDPNDDLAADRQSESMDSSASPYSHSSLFVLAGIALSIAAAVYWLDSTRKDSPGISPSTNLQINAQAAAKEKPKAMVLPQVWTFQNDLPDDLVLCRGKRPEFTGNKGPFKNCMYVGNQSEFLIPTGEIEGPFSMTLTIGSSNRGAQWGVDTFRLGNIDFTTASEERMVGEYVEIPQLRNWSRPGMKIFRTLTRKVTIYFIENRVVNVLHANTAKEKFKRMMGVREYNPARKQTAIGIWLKNVYIESIQIQEETDRDFVEKVLKEVTEFRSEDGIHLENKPL